MKSKTKGIYSQNFGLSIGLEISTNRKAYAEMLSMVTDSTMYYDRDISLSLSHCQLAPHVACATFIYSV
jgi:hypothetical protein